MSIVALLMLQLQSITIKAVEAPDTTPLDQMAAYVRSAAAQMEGMPTELGTVIETTGTSPEAIAQWVRTNIRHESYAGVRKGAAGTLISGTGNSADQALLVASLFEYAGIPAKMAHGTIAEAMLPSPDVAQSKDLGGLPSAAEMETLAKKTGIQIERVYDHAETALRARQTFLEHLWSRTISDLGVLATAMEDAGVPVPVSETNAPTDVDHWWVRTEKGDFDTVLKQALSDADAEYPLTELPETMFQKVVVRMWIQRREITDGSETIEAPESVLDVTFHSAELFGTPIIVGNIPLDIESPLKALENPTSGEIIEVFATATQFQPQISSPRGLLTGHPFDKTGTKLNTKDDRIQSVKKIGGSMGGLFGGSMGGGEEKEVTSHLIGHWLEMELISAEGTTDTTEPIVIRRDLLSNPDSKTNALEILSMREFLIQGDELSNEWFARKTLVHIADTVESTQAMFEAGSTQAMTGTALYELVSDHSSLTNELYGFGLARKNELLRLREKLAPQARFKKDYPMVVSVLRGFSCPGDEIHLRNGLDILYQAFKVIGDSPKSWNESLTFAAGVLDTALERTIMEQMHTPDHIRNSSIALEKALAEGITPRVVVEENAIQIGIPGVVSGEAIASYRVDPTTGMSLGMMDGGGQAMTDYSEETSVVLQLKGTFEFYGNLFKCIGLSITRPLAGGAREHDVQLAKCIWDTACSQITGLVGLAIPVDTNWTNIIATEAANYLFGEVCNNISDRIN